MKILLIAGGWSSEREVSLNGARCIEQALRHCGHSVTFFDPLTEFDLLLRKAAVHDFAFVNLHGSPGEDGLIQAMLDKANCPYQGSGPAGSFLALNKAAAKQLFRHAGLSTPDWEFLPSRPADTWQPALPYPLFVKSNTGGSSLRMARALTRTELDSVLEDIFSAGEAAIIESAIQGREVTCGVLGDDALPPVLIEPQSGEYFDYTSKYAVGGARETCPAPLPTPLLAEIQELALSAHKILGLAGYSRADFMLDAAQHLHLLEVNTLPGMTATSLVPQEARAMGISFDQLMEKLMHLGKARRKN